MPRASNGTYTLPNSAFVTATVIASAVVNGNNNDIAVALTQSLATTGVSTMTSPLPGFAGTVGAPGYTIVGDLTSGFYRKSSNTWAFASTGTEVADFSSAGITAQGINFIDRDSNTILGIPVGIMFDYAGSSAPTGWLFCYGQAISQSTYAALFAIISTTYGNPGGGNFNLPDFRGRAGAGLDNLGGTAAGRLSNAATNGVDGTALANSGGLQNITITQAMFPLYNLPYTLNAVITASPVSGRPPSGVGIGAAGAGGNNVPSTATTVTVTGSFSGSITTGGSGTALNTVQPSIILTKIIFTGVVP